MDDWRPSRASNVRVVRMTEFSRLGKSLLAWTYERVVPVPRAALGGDSSHGASPLQAQLRNPVRKAGA